MNRNSIGYGFLTAALCTAGFVLVAGRPMRSPLQQIDLEHNGVHAPYNIHNPKGDLLFYNFRAVEPGVLYRGSGFPRNKWVDAEKKVRVAAFLDGQTFEFLRARGIRRIIRIQAPSDFKRTEDFYAEPGYFEYWSQKTGYKITHETLPVRAGHAYDPDAKGLQKYPFEEQRSGLRAASDFIEIMKKHKASDGAIYFHCDAGKDRTGVVAAAYELWHNRGTASPDTLWQQVMERYLVSDALIKRDPEASKFAGDQGDCGDGTTGFVCRSWLEKLRPQLETIAQL